MRIYRISENREPTVGRWGGWLKHRTFLASLCLSAYFARSSSKLPLLPPLCAVSSRRPQSHRRRRRRRLCSACAVVCAPKWHAIFRRNSNRCRCYALRFARARCVPLPAHTHTHYITTPDRDGLSWKSASTSQRLIRVMQCVWVRKGVVYFMCVCVCVSRTQPEGCRTC